MFTEPVKKAPMPLAPLLYVNPEVSEAEVVAACTATAGFTPAIALFIPVVT